MSTKRRLVNRDRHSLVQQNDSPRNGRQSAATQEATLLPAYEVPQCLLTADAKRQLEELFSARETKKYEEHLKTAISVVTLLAQDGNDRLVERRAHVANLEKRRQKLEGEGENKQEEYKMSVKAVEEERSFTNVLEKKVDKLTAETEKVMRVLIDCKEELEAQRDVFGEVNVNVAAAPVAGQRRRGGQEDEGDDADGVAPAEDVGIMSALELMQEKKDGYKRQWEAKSLHQRYAENGEYVTYKRVVHDAMFPNEDAPPLSKTTTWFQDGKPEAPTATRRRIQASQAGGEEEGGESDDEPIITAQTQDFRDPISMAIIVNPFTSLVCKHTYEKANILDHIRNEGHQYGDVGRNRARTGPKQVRCPAVGCAAMVEEKDLYEDKVFKRKLERAQKKEAEENEGGDGEEVDVDDDDDAMEI